jgi:hypothetical protein
MSLVEYFWREAFGGVLIMKNFVRGGGKSKNCILKNNLHKSQGVQNQLKIFQFYEKKSKFCCFFPVKNAICVLQHFQE